MNPAINPRRTPLYEEHVTLGARMVDFAGWDMPLNYPADVISEHLSTRRHAGLFDVSHMGRFSVRGPDAVDYLREMFTNDAALLATGRSHYTLLSNSTGGAIDDAYLCRFTQDEFLLVVNASNRQTDWQHLTAHTSDHRVELTDVSEQLAMISLQGPASEGILAELLQGGVLPEPRRNALSTAIFAGAEVLLARTGYTGEPVCFELLVPPEAARDLWARLLGKGATPTGLGARDTLRLEASLPLYGHEQGVDPDGQEIPLLSCPVATYGVSLSAERGDFVGREAIARQHEAYRHNAARDYSLVDDLPRTIRSVAVTGRGIARAGSVVKRDGKKVGWITSGTMVPYWKGLADGAEGEPGQEHELRSICLAYIDSELRADDRLTIEVRGREIAAIVVDRHLRSDSPPYARPVLYPGA